MNILLRAALRSRSSRIDESDHLDFRGRVLRALSENSIPIQLGGLNPNLVVR
jgi:hypothetical protein